MGVVRAGPAQRRSLSAPRQERSREGPPVRGRPPVGRVPSVRGCQPRAGTMRPGSRSGGFVERKRRRLPDKESRRARSILVPKRARNFEVERVLGRTFASSIGQSAWLLIRRLRVRSPCNSSERLHPVPGESALRLDAARRIERPSRRETADGFRSGVVQRGGQLPSREAKRAEQPAS